MADKPTGIDPPAPRRRKKRDRRPPLTRRQFLTRVGLGAFAAATTGVGAYGRWVEPYWPELVRLPLDLPGISDGLAGLRIVQLSDLHMSHYASPRYLRAQVQRAAALEPDIFVITGDFLTYALPGQIEDIEELVTHAKARYGVFASLGNHDYHEKYADFRQLKIPPLQSQGTAAEKLTSALESKGVTVLRNASTRIVIRGEALQLVGIEDALSGYYNAALSFAEVDPDRPCITLSHNPDTFPDLQNRPCDWVLAGHTHGGQVWLPFWGPPILPIRNRRYAAGLFVENGRKMYVNRGLGFLMQYRLNCRPEITEYTLVRR